MKLYSALLILLLTLVACDTKVKVEETGDSTATIDTANGGKQNGDNQTDNEVDTIVRVDTVRVPAPPGGSPPQPGTPQGNIRVSSPTAGSVISGSQIVVKGTARTFENNVVYRLLSPETGELAKGFTTATGEMGTFSPFTFTIPMKSEFAGPATLEVFENSAKDGSVINLVRIPLTLRPSGIPATPGDRNLSVYFINTQKNPGAEDCSRVFAVRRTSSGTVAVAETALNALLQGPSTAERAQGYGSEIPPGTVLRDITINNGVARADFSGEMSRVAGSCRVMAIRAQIEKTLRQFSSVRSVEILVEGKSEDVLQP